MKKTATFDKAAVQKKEKPPHISGGSVYSRYTTSGPPPKVATTNSGCLDDST